MRPYDYPPFLFAAVCVLGACGSDDNGTGDATARPDAAIVPDGSSRPDADPPEDATVDDIQWAGSWSARAIYPAVCMFSSLGGENRVDANYAVALQIRGSNEDLSAVFSNDTGYTMLGSGSGSRLTLSGPFPGRDHNDNSATIVARDNNVTILITDVQDENRATGTIEGTYDTRGGISCTIGGGGTVELTR